MGGREKTSENVETQPSVIKNDLSDDNDQSAEYTVSEPPAPALVETSDEPEKVITRVNYGIIEIFYRPRLKDK